MPASDMECAVGTHVLSDLELDTIHIPTQLPWGASHFQSVLRSPTADIRLLKRRQLALFALRHKDATETCSELREHLDSLHAAVPIVDELEAPLDPRIQETIEQIYWAPTSTGAFLNDTSRVIGSLVFWKTLVLPTIAVLVPLLAIIIPFVLIRFLHGIDLSAGDYMTQLRTIMLRQITIPPILRAKHSGDVIGHMMETGFLAITAITYMSGIWSQITASMHLRTIAVDLRTKGDEITHMAAAFGGILDRLQALPERLQRAIRPFLIRGSAIRADLAELPRTGYAAYGYIWNRRDFLRPAKAWIGELDAMLGIVALQDIAFVRYEGGLHIEDVYHPSLEHRVSNTVSWSASRHAAILTGPNRGGKSTICRAIGVSLLSAQSWGFAFASRMSLLPFTHIETALHPADTLGQLSLFEAEIEFAKRVLAHGKKGRAFVMMDEIFHSTNAADGLAASRVFLKQLFAFKDVYSLISTHYKELPAEFSDIAMGWAMDATVGNAGRLSYTYKLIEGISDKSSVMEILEERGLIGRESLTAPIRG